MARINRLYPGIELRVQTAFSGHLAQWLQSGDIDLTLFDNRSSSPTVAAIPIVEEELWLIGPPGELTGDASPTWEQAASLGLALPGVGHGLRVQIDQVFALRNAKPSPFVETNSLSLQRALAADGQAWSILPASAVASDVRNGTLSGRPLTDPDVKRTVTLRLPRTERGSALTKLVAGEVINIAHEQVRMGTWPGATITQETLAEAALVGVKL